MYTYIYIYIYIFALEPNVITYSVTIGACDKGQQPERVLDLLAESGDSAQCDHIQRDNERMLEGAST